jgi:hypothetical protein
MKAKSYLTTAAAAKIAKVSPETITRWVLPVAHYLSANLDKEYPLFDPQDIVDFGKHMGRIS